MAELWFWLVAAVLAVYTVLDGFDLGAGALHRHVARTERDRRQVFGAIGPVWDGNEVWLLAAGGALFVAFPDLLATAFSGFYLPLMIVLWLFAGRGIAIEFRHHVAGPVWRPFWDTVFTGASALLAVFLGAALGNVARGVPLDATGRFFEPLWTDFTPYGSTGILDWYTTLAGLTALAALSHHGALWLALKTTGPVARRSRAAAGRLWTALAGLTALVTLATAVVQPLFRSRFAGDPAGLLLPAAALAGLGLSRAARIADRPGAAWLGSALYLVGMLASVAFTVYPFVLPSTLDPAFGLRAAAAAAPDDALRLALRWWVPGILLAATWTAIVYRMFAGKSDPHG